PAGFEVFTLTAQGFQLPPKLSIRPDVLLRHLGQLLKPCPMLCPIRRSILAPVEVLRQKPFRLLRTLPAPLRLLRRRQHQPPHLRSPTRFRCATRSDEDMGPCVAEVQLHGVRESIAIEGPAHLRKFPP